MNKINNQNEITWDELNIIKYQGKYFKINMLIHLEEVITPTNKEQTFLLTSDRIDPAQRC